MIGDAFQVAFESAPTALAAALDAQRALNSEFSSRDLEPGRTAPGETSSSFLPLRVRMALHTGETEERGDDYVGPLLNRVARLMAAGHGGQILLTEATYARIRDHLPPGTQLRDLGERRLRDLVRAEHIYQLLADDLPQDFPPLKTLDARLSNLPLMLTSFVGRERELTEVKQRLVYTGPGRARARLLTLTGPGGVGKTRLALQAAADLIDDFPNGVWLVELAPLTDPGLVPDAVASVLGIREQANHPLLDLLADHVRDKQLLLILDNCEQLIGAVAALAERLLQTGPGVEILSTSREALGLPGEVTLRVPSLTLPAREDWADPAALSQYAAVRLFSDRAAAALTDFRLTDANAAALAQICVRLDGIPLAIELAAACVKGLTVEKVAARLDDRFRLLTRGSRTALPRQQTLRALIDWSYDLLSDSERTLLRRLGIFAGGWSLETAEAVCDADLDESTFDLLARLIDKSLVVVDDAGGETRYRLLETIREYALDKLRASGEYARMAGKHFSFFLQVAEQGTRHLVGSEQKEWMARLEPEHDNMRSALAYAVEADPNGALNLATALGRFWQILGFFGEGRQALSRALKAAVDVPKETRAEALMWLGLFAARQGDYTTAQAQVNESLALARELGEPKSIAPIVGIAGLVAWSQGDYASARALYEESLEIYRELHDQHGIAGMLTNLGNLVWAQGDYATARQLNEESVSVFRALGDRQGVALALNNLGVVAEVQGDLALARGIYEESVAAARELNNKIGLAYALNSLGHAAHAQADYRMAHRALDESLTVFLELGEKRGITYCLEGFARLALAQHEADRAARLLAGADHLRHDIGMPLADSERVEIDHALAAVRAELGDRFARVWSESATRSLEEVLALAAHPAQPAPLRRGPGTRGVPASDAPPPA